ncbi:MAG: nitrous oxide reductase accessory protein NosL [Rhodothermales bacterium]
MTTRSRLLTALAGLMLITMYFFPLWRITLEAPQYPEGLGLRIMLSDVRGVNEFDLQNINNLNHYIGMQRIEPDAIPELKIMPWAIAFLIAGAFGVALLGRRRWLTTWVVLFGLLSLVGLVDFWLWEYDYGHNLDTSTAAIVVPGMSYQPPLIGSKQLLNFKAHSWPGVGGWAAFAALGLGMVAWGLDRPKRRRKFSAKPSAGAALGALALPLLLVAGCTPEPEPFHLGQDEGAYCRMTIDDARFASQIVMKTGRVYKFDSIECLSRYLAEQVQDETDVHSVWVSDAAEPGQLVNVTEAVFVQHERLRSPMGGGWAAFASVASAQETVPDIDPDADVHTWLSMRRVSHASLGTRPSGM